MKDKEFAIGTYEIELLAPEELDYVFSNLSKVCGYIDTAIDYNNDYVLRRFKDIPIISKISFCHYDNYEFFVSNHLKALDREYIDIMLIHSNRGQWTELAKKIINDKRFKHVGVSNFTKEDIIKYYEVTGKLPEYNEIETNVNYIDKETIDYCRENNIKIIAYCILGGKYKAMSNIAEYSLPYLMQFAANNSDILILRPDSIRHTNEFIDVVENYQDLRENEYRLYNISKTIEPMKYTVKRIVRRYMNKPSYYIACGKNRDITNSLKEERLFMTLPKFEMLGDYRTYIRYNYRVNNLDSKVYDYDFLIGDDGNYYVVYLIDIEGNLTKVNSEGTTVLVYRYVR